MVVWAHTLLGLIMNRLYVLGVVVLVVVMVSGGSRKSFAVDSDEVLTPMAYPQSPPLATKNSSLDFLTASGLCRVDDKAGSLLCSLHRRSGHNKSLMIDMYGGVLFPGTVSNMGSVGVVFTW